jgi:hypothetical protein
MTFNQKTASHARLESSSETLKNLDGILTGKKARIECLSTLNWQKTFRFQVQRVTTSRTMKKRMLRERSKMHGKPSDRYPLFVAWSEEDQTFIGYCPTLLVGGVCHDENRIAGYAKLVEIVDEDIQSRLEKGETLPEPKSDVWFAEAATNSRSWIS